ncbi:LmbU family transcriptional regulator [Pseudonocardia sp. EC080625-04]|uniref:LmbU family transcriptional regulator n=1 Tax=Pseudonocardia sp. EC080625-04 TaxID=1096868 RepID=UPI000B1F7857|nr:LmbU family transcriptional regulator [Pseudonocardia sp. EC080625-04]
MSSMIFEHEATETDRDQVATVPPEVTARGVNCKRVVTTDVGLSIPRDLSFEAWERAGRQLSGLLNSSSWWLGDWLVYGKSHYSDRYQRGIQAAGLSYQTLRNYAWVARRFDLQRRRAALSFAHHAELASLPVEEQERWLDRSEQMQWTTKQLRAAICAERTGAVGNDTPNETRRLVVPRNRLPQWSEAAQQIGIDLDQWVLSTLDNAAKRVLDTEDALTVDA